jgi:hypothetical protein
MRVGEKILQKITRYCHLKMSEKNTRKSLQMIAKNTR